MAETQPQHGVFINVEVDPSVAGDSALAAKLAEVCPVDIFAVAGDGGVAIVEENLDECVLCRLCIDAAGARGLVKVHKVYSGETLE